MPENRITAVVVSFNVRDLLRKCLWSLQATAEPCRAVVVDNASRDGSAEMVRREFPAGELVALAENVGFARAANLGAGRAATPYIFFINPDAEATPAAPAALADFLDTHPAAAVVGPLVVGPDGSPESTQRDEPTAWNLAREHLPLLKNVTSRRAGHNLRRRTDWLVGAALMVRRDAFVRVGGFDESFFLYYEDADLCLRLRDAGHEIWFEPGARVVHVGGASALPTFGSAAAVQLEYLRRRNHLILKRRGRAALARYRLAQTAFLTARRFAAALGGDRVAASRWAEAVRVTWEK
jgi:N-acetylglucosaminyl-diphospho-decaprenol L-rhamnosyltransferase